MTPTRNGSNGGGNETPVIVTCAVYCRKSVDETNGNGAFNSTDAQRDACLNYVAAQKEQGWVPLDEIFVDAGFSGGTLERPALQRLLAEIEAGRVQVVIVYRADRLSRRILDFLQLVETFDQHGVAFVSVTEQFNTSTPGGRLYQHMLLSFAQYERELIAERTRHKMQAARRKGKWTGGQLVLGFDRTPEGGKLIINKAEAECVREIFEMFLASPSIIGVVEELNRRRLTLKRWVTKTGTEYGGGAFDKFSLKRLLGNPAYIAEVHFDGGIYPAEHDAIVDRETWDRVQTAMNDTARGPRIRSTKNAALLSGILRCAPCDSAMTPTYSQARGRRYRYYLCQKAHRQGWSSCPSKSVPAVEIERFVVDRIRAIGHDPELVAATVTASREALTARRSELEDEVRDTQKAFDVAHAAARAQIADADRHAPRRRRDERTDPDVPGLEDRLAQLRDELTRLRALRIDPADLMAALAAFDPVWEHLTSVERQRIVQTLIERIDYDGGTKKIAITFRPEGVRMLAVERGAEEAGA